MKESLNRISIAFTRNVQIVNTTAVDLAEIGEESNGFFGIGVDNCQYLVPFLEQLRPRIIRFHPLEPAIAGNHHIDIFMDHKIFFIIGELRSASDHSSTPLVAVRLLNRSDFFPHFPPDLSPAG